jgi:hypothetical protein
MATSAVPLAAARTLRAMFCLAPRCCSTAAEIELAFSLMRSMVWLIAPTDSSVASCMPAIRLEISSMALAARLLTSWRPRQRRGPHRPPSPPRSSHQRQQVVCSAIEVISVTTSAILAPASESFIL